MSICTVARTCSHAIIGHQLEHEPFIRKMLSVLCSSTATLQLLSPQCQKMLSSTGCRQSSPAALPCASHPAPRPSSPALLHLTRKQVKREYT